MAPIARSLASVSLLCAALATAGCATVAATADEGAMLAVLRRIDVRTAAFDHLDLSIVVVARNTTSKDIPVSARATLRAAEEGDTARVSGSSKGIALAFKETEISIPVRFALTGEPAALELLLSQDRLGLDIEGSVAASGLELPFSGRREIAPPKLPTVSVRESQVASVDQGASGTGFFKIALDNKNPFDVGVDKFAWRITIKGRELRALGDAEAFSLPASTVTEVEDTVALSEQTFGKELKPLLKQATVPYQIDGYIEVRGIQKPFSFEGDMQFAR